MCKSEVGSRFEGVEVWEHVGLSFISFLSKIQTFEIESHFQIFRLLSFEVGNKPCHLCTFYLHNFDKLFEVFCLHMYSYFSVIVKLGSLIDFECWHWTKMWNPISKSRSNSWTWIWLGRAPHFAVHGNNRPKCLLAY